MNEEVVEPLEQIVQETEVQIDEPVEQEQEVVEKQTQVPLSALQKERQKRKEVELELQWERQRAQKTVENPEEDNSRYESATKEDLIKAQQEAVRMSEENYWIRSNPERYEYVNEHLATFLKQRPNLTSAISTAGNRYEEAYTLMNALTQKEQVKLKSNAAPKKEAPHAPTGIPRAAALNEAVDVMSMDDKEFHEWRAKARRR